MGRLKQKKIFKKLSFKKSIRFFLGIFVLTTISLLFYYITPILFAWSGPSDLPPGGNIDLVGIVRNRFSMVEESVSGNVEIDLSEGSVFKHTLTGNVTYTGIMGFSLGKLNSFKLVVEQGDENVYEITWPGNITWKNYEHPLDLELSSRGIYDFVTLDDGLTWYGGVFYDSRGGLQLGSNSGSKPVCTSSNRGMMWLETEQGDTLSFCGKHLDGTFAWQEYASMWKGITATGGDSVYTFVSDGTNGIPGVTYRVHEFTSVGTGSFSIVDAGTDGEVEYLIVAGGGSGGSGIGGGGGGGGVISNVGQAKIIITNQDYQVFVGAGGAGRTSNGDGNDGSNSSTFSLTAIGGGGGGRHTGGELGTNGRSGGSGGGAGDGVPSANFLGGSGLQPSSVSGGFGNPGGRNKSASPRRAGGGGGAGTAGDHPTLAQTGSSSRGGAGIQNHITGENIFYAGGGGGNHYFSSPLSDYIGGIGGGGNAGTGEPTQSNKAGQDGVNGLGGGGGGGGWSDGRGGAGGSGIVIIRYPITNPH